MSLTPPVPAAPSPVPTAVLVAVPTALLRRHPEWPFALLALLGWVRLGAAAEHRHGTGPSMSMSMSMSSTVPVKDWLVMVVAMMLLLMLPAIRHGALNSIPRRRLRAMVLIAAASLVCWLPFGPLVGRAVGVVAGWGLPVDRHPLVWALFVAALWQLTTTKRRALNACHRTVPLPPQGWAADRACLRFGLLHGVRCFVSGWALMLVMAVPGTMSGMAGVLLAGSLTAGMLAEEWTAAGRRALPAGAMLLAGSALLLAITG
jgi:predicted metal-binding membrane protein